MSTPTTQERRRAVRAVVMACNRQRFRYGTHDCATFVIDCASRINKRNVAQWIAYTNEDEANELIESAGGLSALMSSVFGEPLGSVEDAQVGDPCVAVLPGVGELCAVMGAPGWVLAAGQVGIERVPARCVVDVWPVDGEPLSVSVEEVE